VVVVVLLLLLLRLLLLLLRLLAQLQPARHLTTEHKADVISCCCFECFIRELLEPFSCVMAKILKVLLRRIANLRPIAVDHVLRWTRLCFSRCCSICYIWLTITSSSSSRALASRCTCALASLLHTHDGCSQLLKAVRVINDVGHLIAQVSARRLVKCALPHALQATWADE